MTVRAVAYGTGYLCIEVEGRSVARIPWESAKDFAESVTMALEKIDELQHHNLPVIDAQRKGPKRKPKSIGKRWINGTY